MAENVALQLEKRISFRRAMKKAIQQTQDAGAKGIKIGTKGRLGGAEIARAEWYRVGSVPLQTIRADIDYGFAEAIMTYGKIGVKVWIYKGEIMDRPNLFDIYGKGEKAEKKPQVQGERRDHRDVPAEAAVPAAEPAVVESVEAVGDSADIGKADETREADDAPAA